jgi:hypothetical protein
MYVATVPNRASPPAILLRESFREGGKTKNRTLANISHWPPERIEQLRAVLRGDRLLPAAEAIEIVRALPHGHVLAALGAARRIDLEGLLPRRGAARKRDLAQAMILARVLDPAAKLATARMLDPATASHSLGEMMGLGRLPPALKRSLGGIACDSVTRAGMARFSTAKKRPLGARPTHHRPAGEIVHEPPPNPHPADSRGQSRFQRQHRRAARR